MKINGLILAAGNSSRLGQPKQLLKYQGKSLLADVEDKLVNCCDQVFVVLGYQPELFKREINNAQIIENPNWQSGIGSSLICGAKIAMKNSDGLLIVLSDQPKITAEHYQLLAEKFKKNSNHIIASHYKKQSGVPVIFPNSYFKKLTQIEAQKGAKWVINQHSDRVKIIICESAGFDVDTVEDMIELAN